MSNDHEWLNLIEVSGPFLAVPVLREVFPQGLEALPSGRPQRIRRTYEEWRDAVDMDDPDVMALHAAWINEVLVNALEMDAEVLRRSSTLPERLLVTIPEHGVTIAPDLAVVNPTKGEEPLLLVHVYEPDADLDATRRFDGLAITPPDRMVSLLRSTSCPIGIVTNGERWILVHAPVGSVTSFASWYARLWGQEPETLRAFASLLSVRRFFGPDAEKLPALFERSLKHQDDVTEALGEQVRRAVEVLVQALDRADQDRNRDLLRDVDPRELYEAGLTVMMRLVFLLAAEERGLLLLGDPRYDSFYAISSLRVQLRAESEEILERRRSAWSRLLALFRGVYGGIDHPTLPLPALGGSLFDPDRYPFLEGRKKGTNWRSHSAQPLPIDDRTVLLLLEAIQTFEGRTLSYRALDVEQIGHVYEGLLERTVTRVDDVTLELESSARAKSPRVTLGEIESARLDGTARVVELLKDRSERSESAIRNVHERATDDRLAARLLTVCRGDVGLRDRILLYAGLLRTDPWGYPLVHHAGAFVVVLGTDRRESGTHYTPKSLTEKIVEEALTPVVYRGPAEGKPRDEWELKGAEELLELKICDPAMGSGAFLVQVCRWLSDRLIEAWAKIEADGGRIDSEGRVLGAAEADGYEPLSQDIEERAIVARRLLAERCLYGVDKNPLAVELAKLSLWLTTMAKGRPFGFLDHNLRSGDSLLGVDDLSQLTELSMKPTAEKQLRLFGRSVRAAIDRALELRGQLRRIPIRDIRDVEAMAALDAQSRAEIEAPELIADALIGAVLTADGQNDLQAKLTMLADRADRVAAGDHEVRSSVGHKARLDLAKDTPDGSVRHPLHWPLEFPEVFLRELPGFDAIVGNPPFLGNSSWKSAIGPQFQSYASTIVGSTVGKVDLSVIFHRRASRLLRNGGCYGLLGANNIVEGSSVSVGTERLCSEGELFWTWRDMHWPGRASVVTAVICFCKGEFSGPRTANGVPCSKIGPKLLPRDDLPTWQPVKLDECLYAFKGVDNSKGLSFLLTEESTWLPRLKHEENNLLRPYITGNDITTYALQKVERWALDIADRDIDEIHQSYPEAYRFLIEEVAPQRSAADLKSYKGLSSRWWQFWNHRASQMRHIRRRREFVAFSRVTKHPVCMLADTEWIYTEGVILIDQSREDVLAICQSTFFSEWIVENRGAKFGVGATLRISLGDGIDTFPLPDRAVSANGIEKSHRLNELTVEWCKDNGVGLTEFYNNVGNPQCNAASIIDARELIDTIDQEVLDAYGFEIEISRGFHDAPYLSSGAAYVVEPSCRRQIIGSLTQLNKQKANRGGSTTPLNGKSELSLFKNHITEPESVDD